MIAILAHALCDQVERTSARLVVASAAVHRRVADAAGLVRSAVDFLSGWQVGDVLEREPAVIRWGDVITFPTDGPVRKGAAVCVGADGIAREAGLHQDSRPAPPAYPPPEQVAPGPEACRHPTRLNGQCLRCGDRGALSRHTLSDADEVIRDGATRG